MGCNDQLCMYVTDQFGANNEVMYFDDINGGWFSEKITF